LKLSEGSPQQLKRIFPYNEIDTKMKLNVSDGWWMEDTSFERETNPGEHECIKHKSAVISNSQEWVETQNKLDSVRIQWWYVNILSRITGHKQEQYITQLDW